MRLRPRCDSQREPRANDRSRVGDNTGGCGAGETPRLPPHCDQCGYDPGAIRKERPEQMTVAVLVTTRADAEREKRRASPRIVTNAATTPVRFAKRGRSK